MVRFILWKLFYTSMVFYLGSLPMRAYITHHHNIQYLRWELLANVEFYCNGFYAVVSGLLSLVSLVATDHLISSLMLKYVGQRFGRKVEKIESKLYCVLVMPYVLIYFIRFSLNVMLMCGVLTQNIDEDNKMKLLGGALLQLGLLFYAIELMLHWFVLWRFESESPKPTSLSPEYVIYAEY